MERRTFSPSFKAGLVLAALKEEESLNVIATNSNIAPNLLRNWRSEFERKASMIFDEKRDEKYQEALRQKTEENERLYTKVGQLTTELDWLKKKATELCGLGWEVENTTRRKK